LNDSLTAGAVLGNIGGVISFSLVRNNNTALCPATYGSVGFNTAIQLAISQSNKTTGEDTLTIPCLTESVPF
jgi:hypothetical protein